ncbi:MAG TPA: efflux RND transporter periplasmic adaptor subunit [Clostridia bacterium]|nr:efflux RND transporter periplasmic adaptor subunit [Clostridia bacterium]
MKKLLALILIPVFMLAGCAKNDAPASAESEGKVKYVKTTAVKTRDFGNKLVLPGKIQPKESALVTAKVGGTVLAVRADMGSPVKAGDLLCKIDDTVYELQYEKADAGVKNAQLTLERLKDYGKDSGLDPQQIELARTQYNTAKINYDTTEKEYNRIKGLYDSLVISQSEFEQWESRYNLAKEQFESAESNLSQVERNHGFDVKSAEIALKIAQNDYQMAEENYKDTSVLSPISGIVASRSASVGENTAPGAPVFSVVNLDTVYLESGVSELNIGSLKEGQEVSVIIDALKGEYFSGKLTNISPALDEKTGTYPVKAEVANKGSLIKAGMFGTMEIITDQHKNALAVPKEAVLQESGSNYVYVILEGKAVKKAVTLSYSDEAYYEVLKGLKAEEQVVIAGNSDLKDGEKVAVKN